MTDTVSLRDKLYALYLIAIYRPKFTAAIILFGFLTALLEGIGVTFIVPLVEVAQSPDDPPDDGIVGIFATMYATVGIPFTLGYIVAGLAAVLSVRYLSTFLSEWARVYLRVHYVRELQSRGFEQALDARVAYFDQEGSDDILNAIVTQAEKAGEGIEAFVTVFQAGLLITIYLAVALYLAPVLTVVSIVLVVLLTLGLRTVIESAYTIGDQVAKANEGIQRTVQAGTQGIREVKMIGHADRLLRDFHTEMSRFVSADIRVKRNEALIGNVYNLSVALLIFVLIYIAFVFTDMTFGALGAFLFIMFKLGPIISNTNRRYYQLEGMLPHLIRTERFLVELDANPDLAAGDKPVPPEPLPIEFEDVSFTYDGSEEVLKDISFTLSQGEFVGFVGRSGAGKSTIASLLARLYEPDEGTIYAAGTPLAEYDLREWRNRIAYVRQQPFIFNTSLRENILMANPQADEGELQRVCEIAQVTEFIDSLPEGFDTRLGDAGVRLSGGQRQRVALARALIEDAAVLVLDEATSDLDTNIEAEVQRGIESMNRDITIIAIAHRLSTVQDADRIYTLDQGQIIETGEHETLIASNGRYAELYQAQ